MRLWWCALGLAPSIYIIITKTRHVNYIIVIAVSLRPQITKMSMIYDTEVAGRCCNGRCQPDFNADGIDSLDRCSAMYPTAASPCHAGGAWTAASKMLATGVHCIPSVLLIYTALILKQGYPPNSIAFSCACETFLFRLKPPRNRAGKLNEPSLVQQTRFTCHSEILLYWPIFVWQSGDGLTIAR